MRKHARRILLSCLLFTFITSYAQQKPVKGVVLGSDNEPVAGASVMEKGTPNGTSSDAMGNFTLNVRPSATLIISALGFETAEFAVGDQSTLSIKLSPSTTALCISAKNSVGIYA